MRRKRSFLKEFPFLIVVALVVSLFIKTFIVQFFFIPSGSMENTLQIDDRVAVNRIPFISNNIKRGDVVVFRDPDNWLPAADTESAPFLIAKAKAALVAVGVLPNPAKQYLVKRVVGVAGLADSSAFRAFLDERYELVEFVDFRDHHEFSQREIDLITAFGQQAAVGLRNARLYQIAEDRK